MKTKIKTPKGLKKLKKEHKVNSYGTKSDYRGVIANTRHLKRILVYLQEIADYTWHTDVRENCAVPPDKVSDALLFLNNHNLIKSKRTPTGARKIYYLPKNEELVNKILEVEVIKQRLKYQDRHKK